jgi:hypothetical protein
MITLMRSDDHERMGLQMHQPIEFDEAIAMCAYAIGILYEDAVLSLPDEARSQVSFDVFMGAISDMARMSSNMRLAGAVEFEAMSTDA